MLFTFGVSILTGLVFGLAPLMHTRVKGLVAALKEGGARGATAGAARHHIRRGLVMVEVALAVMLVIGAGLLIRTVYNLSTVDAGFDRSRLVTFAISAAGGRTIRRPARAHSCISACSASCAACPACRRRRRCRACRRTVR